MLEKKDKEWVAVIAEHDGFGSVLKLIEDHADYLRKEAEKSAREPSLDTAVSVTARLVAAREVEKVKSILKNYKGK